MRPCQGQLLTPFKKELQAIIVDYRYQVKISILILLKLCKNIHRRVQLLVFFILFSVLLILDLEMAEPFVQKLKLLVIIIIVIFLLLFFLLLLLFWNIIQSAHRQDRRNFYKLTLLLRVLILHLRIGGRVGHLFLHDSIQNSRTVLDNIISIVLTIHLTEKCSLFANWVIWDRLIIGLYQRVFGSAEDIHQCVGRIPVDYFREGDLTCVGVDVGVENSPIVVDLRWLNHLIIVINKKRDEKLDIGVEANRGLNFGLHCYKIILGYNVIIDLETAIFVSQLEIDTAELLPDSFEFGFKQLLLVGFLLIPSLGNLYHFYQIARLQLVTNLRVQFIIEMTHIDPPQYY